MVEPPKLKLGLFSPRLAGLLVLVLNENGAGEAEDDADIVFSKVGVEEVGNFVSPKLNVDVFGLSRVVVEAPPKLKLGFSVVVVEAPPKAKPEVGFVASVVEDVAALPNIEVDGWLSAGFEPNKPDPDDPNGFASSAGFAELFNEKAGFEASPKLKPEGLGCSFWVFKDAPDDRENAGFPASLLSVEGAPKLSL